MPGPQPDFDNIPFDFLNTEIELATTFIRIAKTELSIDPEHAARALDKAREAVKTVRHFLSKRIAGLDDEQMEVLLRRCRVLETAIEGVAAQP